MPVKTTPYIVFGEPHIGEEEIAEVEACLRSGWVGTGPRVARFERDFAHYKDVDSQLVAAVNSCTAALHACMLASELEPGSEVITTPMTFCATVNAIIHAGLTPVLADIDPVSMNIDPASIEHAITPRTRAILPVHFAGRPCEMDAITAIARKYELLVIEDCAHAIEAEYHGRKTGTIGDVGCFSFYATKNVSTGEGGMIVGRDEALIARARMLALHGMSKDAWHRFSDNGYKHYEVVEAGFKYNMTDIQASLGIHQLARVEANLEQRSAHWQRYMQDFGNLPVTLPAHVEPGVRHARHLFTLQVDKACSGITRDDFIAVMHQRGIGTGVHYISVAEHPYYQQRFGWRPEQWPVAMRAGRQIVSLPLSPYLEETEISRVIEGVHAIIGKRKK